MPADHRSICKKFAIIGGGASGTLLAIRAAAAFKNTDIYLIEKSGNFGAGTAYGLEEPAFLLNVPADKMGAFQDAPAHFYEWIQNNQQEWRGLHEDFRQVKYAPSDFVPRMIYGAYLKSLLRQACSQQNEIYLIADEVKTVSGADEFGQLAIGLDEPLYVDALVFATGNSRPRVASREENLSCKTPYDPEFLNRGWQENDHVIILGTGLSMVDAVHYLVKKGYKGKITAISRNGLLPQPHTASHGVCEPVFDMNNLPRRASEIVFKVRKAIEEAQSKNLPWQDVINALRPVSGDIWNALSVAEQKRLWRALPWWGIVRHRIPDFIYDELQVMMKSGHLDVLNGGIKEIGKNSVVLADGTNLNGDIILNCRGFDYRAQYIKSVCPEIHLSPHWSGTVGVIENSQFRISADYPLYAIGPLLVGTYFESTAIHEIRMQVDALIDELKRSEFFT